MVINREKTMGLLSTNVEVDNIGVPVLKKTRDYALVLCARCSGAGEYQDFTTSCIGRNYFMSKCPVCSGNGYIKIDFPRVTTKVSK